MNSNRQLQTSTQYLADSDDSDSTVDFQADDLARLVGQGLRLEKDEIRPELPQSMDAVLFEEDMVKLKSENKHLKAYITRMQSELARKFSRPEGEDENIPVIQGDAAPWVTNPHIFAPLLSAYDARISEMQSALKLARAELEQSQETISHLNDENSQLLANLNKKMTDAVSSLENRARNQNSDAQWGTVANDTIAELNEQLDLVMKENAILTEQVSILENDVHRLSEQGFERDESLMKISKNFKAATVALRASQQNVQILRQERDASLKRVNNLSNEISTMSIDYENVTSENETKRQQIADLKVQIQDFQTDMDALMAQSGAEIEALEKKNQILATSLRELKVEKDFQEDEMNALKDAARQMKTDQESTHSDCEAMYQSINVYKRQIQELTNEIEDLKKSIEEMRVLREQGELERKQAVASSAQSRKELEKLQQERDAASELHSQEVKTLVEQAHNKLAAQLKIRDEELEGYVQQLAQLSKTVETAKQEQRESVARLESLRTRSDQELRKCQQSMDRMVESVEIAERKALEQQTQTQKTTQKFSQRESEMNLTINSLMEEKRVLQERMQVLTVQAENITHQMHGVNHENEKLTKDTIRLRQELATLRLNMDAKLETMEEKMRLTELKAQQDIAQATAKLQIVTHDHDLSIRQIERIKQHYSAETSSTKGHFDKQLNESRQENTRLRIRAEDLSSQLHGLQQELVQTKSIVTQQEETIRNYDSELVITSRKLTDTKTHVAELLSAEEKRLDEMSQYRRKADELEMLATRARRERDAAMVQLETRNTALEDSILQSRASPIKQLTPSPTKSIASTTRRTKLDFETIRPLQYP